MLNEGGKLLGRSAPIRSILADLERLLPSLTPGRRAPSILLQGETGTGKGLLARTLHEASPRAGRPFVDLNCAAIPATLLEAELFGFERGAFTDARQARPGLIQAAHTGTLFLDEIGLLPMSLQTKLLTVLDTREVRPLGRTRAQAVDVLIVAATNSDLRVAVREGQFREDLYHRLAVLVFSLPPLRDRGEDILELADAFLVRACADHGLASKTLSAAALAALGAHAWPGNVRELANLMDRVALLSPRSTITADDLGLPGAAVVDRTSASEPDRDRPFKESVEGFTRARLEEALSQARGNVSAAADQLGVPRSTLRYQLERLGLAPGRTRGSRQPTSPRARVSSITETPALPDEAPGRKPLGERILTSGATLDPERKHVTVLFAGLTGSPELFADSGGDERHRLVDPAFEQMLEGVRRYDGTVDAVRDDGIVALFGAPLAREDHALRGCDAAFAIREAVERHAEELRHAHGLDLQVRIGLHSGDVVVRSVGDERRLDYVAAPETMNLAARLEQLAGAGTTLVTASTLRLAEGFVEVVPRGFVPVPGVARPLDVYELRGRGAVRSRLAAAVARGLTRLVGRESEMTQLRGAVDRASAGHGQVVALVGEAGVGKSRLTWELTRSLAAEGWLVLETGSVSASEATAYGPLADLLRGYFEIGARDEPRRVREAMLGKLGTLDESLWSLATPLLRVVDVPVDDPEWEQLDPRERRRRTLDAARRLLLRESQMHGVAIVVDDLQWVDSETHAFLDLLVESVPAARVLLLVSYRPEGEHAWSRKTYYTQVRLDPLPAPSAGELLDALIGPEATSLPVKELLIQRTEGNPFFLEESVRALVETGALVGTPGAYRPGAAESAVRMPTRVESVLAARIDRLAPEDKRLLQISSVIGKDVPFALLRLIDDRSEDETRRGLAALQSAEFLYEKQLYPELEYTFKHALTHEVAYQSLLEGARRPHHERIAKTLEEKFPAARDAQPELLARHFTEAGLAERAAEYWLRAAQRATGRWAYPEAVRYASQGIDVARLLPESDERDRLELVLQLALISPLQASRGWSAAELEPVLQRCQYLCDRVGEAGQLESLLRGQMVFYLSVDLARARDLGERHLALVQRLGRSSIYSHAMLAHILRSMGRFEEALAHADAGLAVYDPAEDSPRTKGQLVDGRVGCLSDAAAALWCLGFPDQGWVRVREMLDHARRLESPFSLSWALLNASRYLRISRDEAAGGAWLEEGVRIAREYGFRWLLGWGAIESGWRRVRGGSVDEGLALFREGLDLLQAQGTRVGQSINLSFLAEAYGHAGQAPRGLDVLADALGFVERVGERHFESGLHRVRGELLAALGSDAAGEASFRRALQVAREQNAKSLELRAALSLARLWQRRGRIQEARELLAEIHAWFTEGFDRPDVTDARQLLDELSPSAQRPAMSDPP